MSKTLLIIHSHSLANETVERHWPYYKRGGCDILGVGRIDTPCHWPEPCPTVNIGREIKGIWQDHKDDNLIYRMIDTFDHVLKNHEFEKYDDFCLIEYDCVPTGKLPDHTGGFLSHLSGGGVDGFKASQFFHCPWWVDRPMARLVVDYGKVMINQGDTERGTPDFFIGRMADRFGIQIHKLNAYSRNTIDNIEWINEARQAVKAGVHFVHGIKDESILKLIFQ